MSADRAQKDMICRLLAELVDCDPARVKRVLATFGFKYGDVSFMVTDKGNFWTEVWRWPWGADGARPDGAPPPPDQEPPTPTPIVERMARRGRTPRGVKS